MNIKGVVLSTMLNAAGYSDHAQGKWLGRTIIWSFNFAAAFINLYLSLPVLRHIRDIHGLHNASQLVPLAISLGHTVYLPVKLI